MDVIRENREIPENLKGAFVTIGNFDGVHLGHRSIFRRLVEAARLEGDRRPCGRHEHARVAEALAVDQHLAAQNPGPQLLGLQLGVEFTQQLQERLSPHASWEMRWMESARPSCALSSSMRSRTSVVRMYHDGLA